MSRLFSSMFRFGATPVSLLSQETRYRLARAVLSRDPALFRETLRECCPDLTEEHRLYGVLIETPSGAEPVMVDETGQRLGPGYRFRRDVPIDLLNAEFGKEKPEKEPEKGGAEGAITDTNSGD
jgi:hypothetical protein